jgi:hypothetical protein
MVTQQQLKALERFIDLAQPERVSKTLRTLLVEYLVNKSDLLPLDFDYMIEDVRNLFELLDRLGFKELPVGEGEE